MPSIYTPMLHVSVAVPVTPNVTIPSKLEREVCVVSTTPLLIVALCNIRLAMTIARFPATVSIPVS
ncbi:Uncharacterised protein [uncultured archaeon]|nr:Uncharacterised protein [uncultured archaeon]